jgi:hypothetical protein
VFQIEIMFLLLKEEMYSPLSACCDIFSIFLKNKHCKKHFI